MTAKAELAEKFTSLLDASGLHTVLWRQAMGRLFANLAVESGWRPPRRVIKTMDEVAAITSAAAIRTQHGDLMFRDDSEFDDWYHVGTEMSVGVYEGDLPATVLFEGEA